MVYVIIIIKYDSHVRSIVTVRHIILFLRGGDDNFIVRDASGWEDGSCNTTGANCFRPECNGFGGKRRFS